QNEVDPGPARVAETAPGHERAPHVGSEAGEVILGLAGFGFAATELPAEPRPGLQRVEDEIAERAFHREDRPWESGGFRELDPGRIAPGREREVLRKPRWGLGRGRQRDAPDRRYRPDPIRRRRDRP